MKNLILLLLLTVNLFGQEVKLNSLHYTIGSADAVLNEYEPSEFLKLEGGLEVKLEVSKNEETGVVKIRSAYINNVLTNQDLTADYLLLITKSDTVIFTSINSIRDYGEDILVPPTDIYKLNLNPIKRVIIFERGKEQAVSCTARNPDYFKRFLPLLTYAIK